VGEDNQANEDIALSPQANLFFTHCSILAFGDGGGINHFRDDYGYLVSGRKLSLAAVLLVSC